jgi:hypothetical protein
LIKVFFLAVNRKIRPLFRILAYWVGNYFAGEKKKGLPVSVEDGIKSGSNGMPKKLSKIPELYFTKVSLFRRFFKEGSADIWQFWLYT